MNKLYFINHNDKKMFFETANEAMRAAYHDLPYAQHNINIYVDGSDFVFATLNYNEAIRNWHKMQQSED